MIESLLRDVPAALLEPSGRAGLLTASARLPVVLARWNVGLELRLRGPARGDLFLAVAPGDPDAAIVREWLADFPGGSAGARLGSALARWGQGSGWLARSCRFVLLEVDASRAVDGFLPPPAVFLVPLADAFDRDPDGLVGALGELAGAPTDPTVLVELRELLALLPDGAELFAAGAMLSRPTAAAPRIAVRGLKSDQLTALLTGLGRPDAAALLAPLAGRLEPSLTDLCVALDVGRGRSDAVGLELYAHGPSPTGVPSGWDALLDELVALDVAAPERARAALELARGGVANGVTTRLNHVKLTATADGLAPAKLYAVMHAPLDVSGL